MAICPAGHSSAADDYCDVCGARIGTAPVPDAAPPPDRGAGGEACPDCGTARTDRFCENCGYDYVLGGGRPTPPAVPTPPAAPAAPAPPAAPSLPFPGPVPSGTTTPFAAPSSAPPPMPASGPSAAGSPRAPATSAPTVQTPGRAPGQASADDEEPVTQDWSPPPGHFPRPAGAWVAVVSADRAYYERVVVEGAEYAFPPYCPEREIPLSGQQMRIGRRSVSQGTVPEIDLSEPPADPGVSHTHAVLLAQPDGTWTLVDPGSTNGTTVNESDDPITVNVEVPMHDGDRIHLGVWTTITLRRPV